MSRTKAILITFFLSGFGVHRFMAGKTGTGILWLLTGGCFGIGAIVDFVMVCTGNFKDKNGQVWGAENNVALSYNMPVKMRCSRCGKEAEGKTIFCRYCGGKMEDIKPEIGNSGQWTSPAQVQVRSSRENQYLAIIIVLVVAAIGYLGFTYRGRIYNTFQGIYSNFIHTVSKNRLDFQNTWELTDYLDKTQNEIATDFPYELDENFGASEEEGMIFLDMGTGGLEDVFVIGEYPKISVYGIKTGMSIQEIKEIIENKHMIVVSESDDGINIEPEDSYSIISITFGSNKEFCEGWSFTRGEKLSAEEKKAESETCIEQMKNQSFQKYQCTYGETFEALYGESGTWSYSMVFGDMQGNKKGLRYEAGDDYYLWYVDGKTITFQTAVYQENFFDNIDELETELAKTFPDNMLASTENNKDTTNDKKESSSWQNNSGTTSNNTNTSNKAIIRSNDYILPYSDSMYYTKKDLESLTSEELRIARNELYARYGRRFQDKALQAHFDACSWYDGYIEPGDFQESVLNDYEVANRDLIKECEEGGGSWQNTQSGYATDSPVYMTREEVIQTMTEDSILNLVSYYMNAPIIEIDGYDGNIMIVHLYEIVDNGDEVHQATWDWLWIDTETLYAENVAGTTIDLLQYGN